MTIASNKIVSQWLVAFAMYRKARGREREGNGA